MVIRKEGLGLYPGIGWKFKEKKRAGRASNEVEKTY